VGIRINQNVMAMNAYRNLTSSEGALSKSLERLSSGFRINRAADDAAGLVISEGLRSQVMGLKMATRNAQDGVSVVQTAEGALTETHAILQRMRELAIQAASTGSSDQPSRDAAQVEVVQLQAELDRIGNTTKFGAQTLLDGTYGRTNQIQKTSTGQTLNLTTNDGIIAIDPDGDPTTNATGGAAALINVDLTAGGTNTKTYDAAVASDVKALEADLNTAIKSAFSALYGGSVPFTARVTTNGLTGVNAKFVTTISSSNANQFFSVDEGAGQLGGFLGYAAGLTDSAPGGSGGVFQVGSGVSTSDQILLTINDVRANKLGVDGSVVDVSDASKATSNITAIDTAITTVSTLRGNLGAFQNRFEHTIANLSVTTENLAASESRIRDTDMAAEMMSFTRAQILQQAGTAMLAQANAVPQTVLQLLK
jgi:flagellin